MSGARNHKFSYILLYHLGEKTLFFLPAIKFCKKMSIKSEIVY